MNELKIDKIGESLKSQQNALHTQLGRTCQRNIRSHFIYQYWLQTACGAVSRGISLEDPLTVALREATKASMKMTEMLLKKNYTYFALY